MNNHACHVTRATYGVFYLKRGFFFRRIPFFRWSIIKERWPSIAGWLGTESTYTYHLSGVVVIWLLLCDHTLTWLGHRCEPLIFWAVRALWAVWSVGNPNIWRGGPSSGDRRKRNKWLGKCPTKSYATLIDWAGWTYSKSHLRCKKCVFRGRAVPIWGSLSPFQTPLMI